MNLVKNILAVTVITAASMNANAAFVVKETKLVKQTETIATQNISNTATSLNPSSISEVKNNDLSNAITTETAKADDGISKGVYILLAILGLGWLAMGLKDDFSGSDWIVSLLLYCLLWLPGFIYTLVKMKKYYN